MQYHLNSKFDVIKADSDGSDDDEFTDSNSFELEEVENLEDRELIDNGDNNELGEEDDKEEVEEE